MVNFIPLEAKDGRTVRINQIELQDQAKVAERLGYTEDEFRDKFNFAAPEFIFTDSRPVLSSSR
ncbi:MAG: hypothetical protein AAB489_03640 [Patescibacteria group bacterium]